MLWPDPPLLVNMGIGHSGLGYQVLSLEIELGVVLQTVMPTGN